MEGKSSKKGRRRRVWRRADALSDVGSALGGHKAWRGEEFTGIGSVLPIRSELHPESDFPRMSRRCATKYALISEYGRSFAQLLAGLVRVSFGGSMSNEFSRKLWSDQE